ncbi:hypothetical protein EV122DRAFT_283308 [Schizophyllum commune]
MSDTQKSNWSLPPDPDDDLSIPTLPTITASLRRNKISNQPTAVFEDMKTNQAEASTPVENAGDKTNKSRGFESIGYHPTLDALLKKELEDAIVKDVDGLIEELFPPKALPVSPETVFAELQKGSTPMYANGRWNCANLDRPNMERPLATFLDRLGMRAREIYADHDKEVKEIRQWSADFCDHVLPGGLVSRKPDVSLTLRGPKAEWKTHCADAQLKSRTKDRNEATAQLYDGALNTLAVQDERRFHIGIAFLGHLCFLNYSDRVGCLQSTVFNIHEDPLQFLRVFLGLTVADKVWLGHDPTIIHEGGKRYVTVAGVKYEIFENLTQSSGIRGLGAVVWSCVATEGARKGRSGVIKSSWTDRSRAHSEEFYLKRANDAGVEGVPTLIAYEHVRDGPNIVSTETIRRNLKYPDQCKVVFEVRDLTRLVIEELGVPLHAFANKTEFFSAIRDIVAAHEQLYFKAKILHSDIHDKNVLLKAVHGLSPGSRRVGFLIDLNYGMPTDETRDKASSGLRSCPTVFVASDILTWPELFGPELRYDLQSILSLIIWICVCYGGPKSQPRMIDLQKSKIAGWLQIDEFLAGASKSAVLALRPRNTFGNFMHETFHRYWDDVRRCVSDIREVVMREDPAPTHAELLAVLDHHIPKIRQREEGQETEELVARSASVRKVASLAPSLGDRVRRSIRLSSSAGKSTESEPSTQRGKGSRKRGAMPEANPNSPYFEGQCICRKVAKLGERVIQCRNPGCQIFFHEECSGFDSATQNPTTWVCDTCWDQGYRRESKLRKT